MWSFVGKSPGCPQQPIFERGVDARSPLLCFFHTSPTYGAMTEHNSLYFYCICIWTTLVLHVCTYVHFIRGNKWKFCISYQVLCLSISIPHCQSLSFLRHWALQDNLVKPLSSLCALPLFRRGSPCSRQFWWNSPHLLQFSVASGTHTASSWSGSSTPPHSKHLTHISRF